MFNLRSLMLSAFFMTGFILSTPAYTAANVGVSPTQVNLSPSNKTSVVTVLNKGSNPVNLQLDAKSWDMDEKGKFIETETGDFVFYPKTLTIKPQDQALIRVGYIGEFPNAEKPYRLFIEEVPEITQVDPEKNKVKIGLTSVLRLSMPVYVVPASEIPAPQVELSALKTDKNTLRVGIKNLTSYHIDLKKVSVKLLKQGKVLAEKAVDLKLQRVLGDRLVFINLPLAVEKLCAQADSIAVQVEAHGLTEAYQANMALKSNCQL